MRILFFAAALLLMVSCSQKPKDDGMNFHLEGTAERLPDGEKLLLTDSEGFPVDTLTVTQGKFSYSAKIDTVSFYTIFVMNDPSNNVNFFTEPGTVQMKLSAKMSESTISGTTANDALQLLMTETAPYYEKINEIEEIVSSDTTLNSNAEWALTERYLQFYGEIEKKMQEAAEKNIDNELGYMLVVKYIDEQQNADLLRQLITKMPQKFRQRKPVVSLLALIESYEDTAEGHIMPDFTLKTIAGEQKSVMEEVKQHKFTILDFWASWCEPCRKEMPFMRQLFADYKEKGLGIIGISLDEKAEEWKKAIEDLKTEWVQLSDLKGRETASARSFRVSSIPYTVVVDSAGVILKKGLRGDDLRDYVSRLLP